MSVSSWRAEICLHIFQLLDSEPERENVDNDDNNAVCDQWELPCRALSSDLWESIVVPRGIKNRLLGYCSSSLAFADHSVDVNIISWNRMIMLHGPPGTGKTTLCKALAQKVFIRSDPGRYHSGVLLEINSHSLFSKWFSESGKLV